MLHSHHLPQTRRAGRVLDRAMVGNWLKNAETTGIIVLKLDIEPCTKGMFLEFFDILQLFFHNLEYIQRQKQNAE